MVPQHTWLLCIRKFHIQEYTLGLYGTVVFIIGKNPCISVPWWFKPVFKGQPCIYIYLYTADGCSVGKEPAWQCRRHKRCGFSLWVGKMPWRKKWQPAPVFLPRKFHGQRILEGYSPWSLQRVGQDWAPVRVRTHTNTHTHTTYVSVCLSETSLRRV